VLLFFQLLKVDDDQPVMNVETACKQIVDRLVQTALIAANGQSHITDIVLCGFCNCDDDDDDDNNWSQNLTKGCIACCAVIEDWMIPFTVYTSTETSNAFQLAGQPPKLPLPCRGISTPSTTWFLGPTHVSHPNCI